jgi:hypothetical protein
MDPRTEKMLAERAERMAATPPPLRGSLQTFDGARFWVKTHANTARLLAGGILAVLFAAYYLSVALPAQRADQARMETRAAERLKTDTASHHATVADCLSKAQIDADQRWTAACKARRQGPNCPLPEEQADAFDRAETAGRNACLIGH